MLRREIVEPHVAPGASAAACVRVGPNWLTALGASGRLAPDDPTQVNDSTWYDLASLTKPLVAFCFARWFDRGGLAPTATLAEHLPWARGLPAGEARLEQLLSHRSGLEAHVELFAEFRDGGARDRERLLRVAAERALPAEQRLPNGDYPPTYSDLGYLLLGEVLRVVGERPLDEILTSELDACGVDAIGSSRQLGLSSLWNVAPTETVTWRGGRVQGVVHDENAFVASDRGTSGHAGMFGQVGGVARFAQLMLDVHAGRSAALGVGALALLLERREGGSMRGGFDGKDGESSSAGRRLGPASFGHLGFTGTSFWCDPEQDLAVVLLSNRVCPSRDNVAIRAARPRIHDQLVEIGLSLRADATARGIPNPGPTI